MIASKSITGEMNRLCFGFKLLLVSFVRLINIYVFITCKRAYERLDASAGSGVFALLNAYTVVIHGTGTFPVTFSVCG